MNHKPQSLTSIPEKVSNNEAAPNGAKLAMGQRKSRHKKTNFLRVDDFLNIWNKLNNGWAVGNVNKYLQNLIATDVSKF